MGSLWDEKYHRSCEESSVQSREAQVVPTELLFSQLSADQNMGVLESRPGRNHSPAKESPGLFQRFMFRHDPAGLDRTE